MTEEIKFNSKNKNIRMEGEEGSPQNQLRYELYKEGFESIFKKTKDLSSELIFNRTAVVT